MIVVSKLPHNNSFERTRYRGPLNSGVSSVWKRIIFVERSVRLSFHPATRSVALEEQAVSTSSTPNSNRTSSVFVNGRLR
jgi:hypothetical protein